MAEVEEESRFAPLSIVGAEERGRGVDFVGGVNE